MRDGFENLSPTSSQASNEDVFDVNKEVNEEEEEAEYSDSIKEVNLGSNTVAGIETEETNLMSDEMVDLILDYVSYRVGEGSDVTGIEKVDGTIQNCRNSGFRKSAILGYLVDSGYLDLGDGNEGGESVEDSLSYIQSMLQHKSNYIPDHVEELVLVVSSATKLFILELMASINKMLNRGKSDKKVITVQHIYDAFLSQRKLIPEI
ncbi:hypothetical protein HWI79_268 [Cryptosporidium felis]|nr:hypothetical protein HWI79_268 [Cryptosporidium felis]